MRRVTGRFILLLSTCALSQACGAASTPSPSSNMATTDTHTASSSSAPAEPTPEVEPAPNADADGDGIVDGTDQCVNEREIYNTVEDDDGCPDTGPIVLY